MNKQREKPLAGVRVLVLFGGDRMFGSELANMEVFRNLCDMGASVRFITSSRWGKNEIQPELDRLGFEWTSAPFGYQWGRFLLGREWYLWFVNVWGIVATNWRVWREARRWKPTHLYHMNSMFFGYTLPCVLWLKQPLVFRAGDELPSHTALHRWIARRLLGRADSMVCVSNFTLERFAALGMAPEKMRVIYSYPPDRARAASVEILPAPPGAVIVTYVGQIAEHKGVLVLFDAVEQMIRRGDNLVLWVAGDPTWDEGITAMLKARAGAADLHGRVVLLGFVKNVFPLLERTDIHVCPSLFAEPLPNVVGEAKLCGKPSVVFPSGGLPELIEHGVDGYICRDKSAEALVEGLEFFADDDARRNAAGVAARKSLDDKFGLARYRAAWADVILKTLKS